MSFLHNSLFDTKEAYVKWLDDYATRHRKQASTFASLGRDGVNKL
jgi:hypothetical protein